MSSQKIFPSSGSHQNVRPAKPIQWLRFRFYLALFMFIYLFQVKDNVSINSFYSEDDETVDQGTGLVEVTAIGAEGGTVSNDDTVDFTDDFYSEQEMKAVIDNEGQPKERTPRRKKPLKVRIAGKKGSKKSRQNEEDA